MNNPQNNHILSALPKAEYQHLLDLLEPVNLPFGEIPLKPGQKCEYLYFPTQAVVSQMLIMDKNLTTEIGLIGKEGMVGTLQFLGDGSCHSETLVQVEGTAMRIESQALRVEFERSKILQKLLLRYALKLFNQVSQGAGFELPDSRLRGAQALQTLLMLLATAMLIAISAAITLVADGKRSSLDWHSRRGLSYFQLGLRHLQSLCHQRLPIPRLTSLPQLNPKAACASRRKRRLMDYRIEFAKVTEFDARKQVKKSPTNNGFKTFLHH